MTDQRRAEQAAFRGAWQIATSVCCEAEQCDMGLLLIKYICSVFTFARDSQVLETLSFSVFGFSYLNYFKSTEGRERDGDRAHEPRREAASAEVSRAAQDCRGLRPRLSRVSLHLISPSLFPNLRGSN